MPFAVPQPGSALAALNQVRPSPAVPPAAMQALASPRGPWTLPAEYETAFQRDMMFAPGFRDWYRSFNQRFGGAPDLNDPEYNYRLAWAHGVVPTPYEHDGNFPHWPSELPAQPPRAQGQPLKAENHPTRWMQTFMDRYGVDPNEASPDTLARGLREGVVPLRMPEDGQ